MQGINSKLNGRPIKAKVMGKARGSEKLLDRSGKRRKLIQENGQRGVSQRSRRLG
ncbi:hypothetical protein ACO22_07813 [Paracoccidioides brasiliensis]|uniref:Uncharacterized protein n=1 Tax=Paracoccidioides brasiliensis TaxID=121759 RepID=A0A1D2J3K5_PARBR|nr:hypothetical protein ACO22_07813 [Paracoccidioides brasiliensis]